MNPDFRLLQWAISEFAYYHVAFFSCLQQVAMHIGAQSFMRAFCCRWRELQKGKLVSQARSRLGCVEELRGLIDCVTSKKILEKGRGSEPCLEKYQALVSCVNRVTRSSTKRT